MSTSQKNKSIFETLKDDVRNTNAYSTFRKESKEITNFYLTDEQRTELKRMKRIKGTMHISGWVLKAMFYKLTPIRRLFFVVGMILVLSVQSGVSGTFNINGSALFGGFLLVLVILLELKDKLLAHDELEEGRHIQELLMPERTPAVNGWSVWLYTRSANEVCGDLVDFLRLENGRNGLALADVAGKGLHAALLTTKLQATIRALAFEQQHISTLVEKVNAIFHRDSPSHLFASLLYLEINENDGRISFVNAGHLPALIVRRDSVEETYKGDLALGLTRTVTYHEQSTDLVGGDLVVLYSDGITEAKNDRGEFFGKDRLMQLIRSETRSAEQVGHAILRDIDRFIGTQNTSDDLSLIILKRL